MKKQRLTKLMALRGLCSRREAEKYIARGLVRCEGTLVTEVGQQAALHSDITLDQTDLQHFTVALHKPLGVVSNLPQRGEKEAKQLLTPENRFDRGKPLTDVNQLHVVGRLDIHSKGLLLFSSDGRVAKHIIGPDSKVEKEYVLRFKHAVSKQAIQKLSLGLSLDGKPLKRARVRQMDSHTLTVILREGRKRQIRRMCLLLNLQISSLKRVRIGTIQLGSLPVGRWRIVKPMSLTLGHKVELPVTTPLP